MKNLIKNNLKAAHNNYFSRIFDASIGGNRCQFLKYIRAKHKDNNEISTLKVNGQCISDTKGKANALNNYFKSVFTNKDLSHIPPMDSSRDPISSIPNVTITVSGIQHLLSTLNTNKACGPNHISPYILKHCTEEISVLQIIFSQYLDSGVLPTDWLVANVCPIHKKRKPHRTLKLPANIFNICLLQGNGTHIISCHHRTSYLKQFAYK